MATPSKTLVNLETKFWESMLHQDTDAALDLLCEPALMVSSHGSIRFDHAGYRKMAEQGPMVLTAFEFGDMDVVFPNDSTAVLSYRVKQTLSPRDKDSSDKALDQVMNDTSTWIRTDGDGKQWQCVMHTETPAQARPS